MRIHIIIPIITLLSLFNCHAFAWNNTKTHPHITKEAVELSSFDQYLKEQLDIAYGKNELIDEKEIVEWLQYGSKEEDRPACRASNHFHNPYRPWAQAGLTDMHWLIGWWCGLTSPYSTEEITSSLVWGTGFLDRSGTSLDLETINDNEWDWFSAQEYFYTYLTGRDDQGDTVAFDHDMRNAYLAKTLRAIGQVLHLLQDAAVPAHVRDDFSEGHLMVTPGPDNPLGWIGNRFEKYVERRDKSGSWFSLAPVHGNLGSLSMGVADLWDTEQLSDSIAPTDMSTLGLAEYTAMNFFSEYSIFSPDFPYPRPQHCVVIASSPPPPTATLLDRLYLSSQNGHPGEQIDHLAIVSYLNHFIETYVPNVSSEKIPLSMDDNCYDDYARHLIPHAVGYSADLLDYFFRGKIDLVIDEASDSGYVIENKTEEEMEGAFELFYDNTSDERIQLWSDSYSLGAMGTDNDKSEPFEFAPPDDAKEPGRYILVFRGILGNEPNAVLGKVLSTCWWNDDFSQPDGSLPNPEKWDVFTLPNGFDTSNWINIQNEQLSMKLNDHITNTSTNPATVNVTMKESLYPPFDLYCFFNDSQSHTPYVYHANGLRLRIGADDAGLIRQIEHAGTRRFETPGNSISTTWSTFFLRIKAHANGTVEYFCKRYESDEWTKLSESQHSWDGKIGTVSIVSSVSGIMVNQDIICYADNFTVTEGCPEPPE